MNIFHNLCYNELILLGKATLAMQYAGNRLMSVTDGNLASDGHTGFEFSYNILNLPMSAEDGADGSTMTYTYLSDGTKLKAVSDGGAGLSYRGSFVYGLSSGGGCTLESVATDEGRIVMDGTAVKDEWHVRDHVGNVRSVVWLNAPAGTSVSASILEQNDYLPRHEAARVKDRPEQPLPPRRQGGAGHRRHGPRPLGFRRTLLRCLRRPMDRSGPPGGEVSRPQPLLLLWK